MRCASCPPRALTSPPPAPRAGKTLEWREEAAGGGGGGRLVAALPLSSVQAAAATGKGEVQVQFMDEDNVEREDEVLVEMRLFVAAEHELADAAAASAAARKRAQDLADRRGVAAGGDEDDAEAAAAAKAELVERAGADAAMQLHALITDAAGVAGVAGDAIAGAWGWRRGRRRGSVLGRRAAARRPRVLPSALRPRRVWRGCGPVPDPARPLRRGALPDVCAAGGQDL